MRQLKISKSVTNREAASLDRYLAEITRIPLISPHEEERLGNEIRAGRQEAVDRMVLGNLRFVVSVAKQYQNQGLSLPDLINEGNAGLVKAARLFDQTRGFRFISYAVWWIRQAILFALAEQARIVKLPQGKVVLYQRILGTIRALEQELHREPSVDEVSERTGRTAEDILLAMRMNIRHISMDLPVTEDEEGSLGDVLEGPASERADNRLAYHDSLTHAVGKTLETLSPRQKEIVRCYYGIGLEQPMSLEDIGAQFQISRERTRQIRDMALDRLKHNCVVNELREFLGQER